MTDRIHWGRLHHRRPRRVFKQLIGLKFLMASTHWACADVLDHHIMGAHQPTATSTAQTTSALTFN